MAGTDRLDALVARIEELEAETREGRAARRNGVRVLESEAPVSRRRRFGMAGAAAAGAAGAAIVTAAPAGAAGGGNLLMQTGNVADANQTGLTSTNATNTFDAANTSTGGGIRGVTSSTSAS